MMTVIKAIRARRQAQMVIRGAQRCLTFWQSQGEPEMVAQARARLDRVIAGTANEPDILGALDWLDE